MVRRVGDEDAVAAIIPVGKRHSHRLEELTIAHPGTPKRFQPAVGTPVHDTTPNRIRPDRERVSTIVGLIGVGTKAVRCHATDRSKELAPHLRLRVLLGDAIRCKVSARASEPEAVTTDRAAHRLRWRERLGSCWRARDDGADQEEQEERCSYPDLACVRSRVHGVLFVIPFELGLEIRANAAKKPRRYSGLKRRPARGGTIPRGSP